MKEYFYKVKKVFRKKQQDAREKKRERNARRGATLLGLWRVTCCVLGDPTTLVYFEFIEQTPKRTS